MNMVYILPPLLAMVASLGNFWITRRPTLPKAGHTLMSAAMALGVAMVFHLDGQTLPMAITTAAILAVLSALAVSDFTQRLLSDKLNITAIGLALAWATVHPNYYLPNKIITNPTLNAVAQGILGGAAAFVFLWLVVKLAAPIVCKKRYSETDLDFALNSDGLRNTKTGEVTSWSDMDPRMFIELSQCEISLPGAPMLNTDKATLSYQKLRIGDEYYDVTQTPITLKVKKASYQMPAMGWGDFKLIPSLGILSGLSTGLLEIIIVGGVLGTLHGLITKLAKQSPFVPFGSYLILGAFYYLGTKMHICPSVVHFLGHVGR